MSQRESFKLSTKIVCNSTAQCSSNCYKVVTHASYNNNYYLKSCILITYNFL